jgi:putative effector of murein hydrolase
MTPEDNKEDGIEVIGFLLFTMTMILFIIKIEWYIDISWWFVFAPIWITIILTIGVVICFEIMNTFKNKKE